MDLGSIPGRDNDRIFSLFHSVHTGCVPHPGSYPTGTAGGGGLSAGIKRPGCQAELFTSI